MRGMRLRVVLDDPLVLRDCPVVPLFLDVLLGSLERSLAFDLLHGFFFRAREASVPAHADATPN